MEVQAWKYDEEGYLIDILFVDDEKELPVNVTFIQPEDALYSPRFLYGKWTNGSEPPIEPPLEESSEIEGHLKDQDKHFRPGEREKLESMFGTLSRESSLRIDANITALTTVSKADTHYMSTVDTNRFTDHPNRGVAGWFLIVTKKDTGSSFIQFLIRSSRVIHEIYYRVTSESDPSSWAMFSINAPASWQNLPLANGSTAGEVMAAYSVSNRQLFFRGSIKAHSNLSLPLSTLPSGRRPTTLIKTGAYNVTKNQTVGITIEADTGRMLLRGDITTNDEISLDGVRFWTE
ncbi:hypothetical protein [Alkalicoccobacillus plakortidis]|uniref:Phage tail protein n=1 Tax=Alkalicoccobacillus plakortidis TaxID=444060 RepID=A0ABT0XI38_9BACI|nr:hypothetical protein [Alkalicoccobacillus plakortidis]MCM2675566.1 hypothetical protein [Alkalicoccobacillus plakortidis]